MADETRNVGSAGKGAVPLNSNKFTMYIMLGLIVLLITVMIMATVLILTFSKMKQPKTIYQNVPNNYTANQNQNSNQNEEFGLLVPLNEMIVNLASVTDDEHYLKVNITLEVTNDEKVKEEVTKRVPQLRDLVISILRTKSKDEIDQKEGKENLSGEILNSIDSHVGEGKVKHVFFEDFMIQ